MAATIAAMDAAGVAKALISAWVAPRNAMPTRVQLELIENVRPIVPVGVASFAPHMANIADPKVNDFQVVLNTGESGLEDVLLRLELKRGADATEAVDTLRFRIRQAFELAVATEVLPNGEPGKDFEKFMKAPRFVDRRV